MKLQFVPSCTSQKKEKFKAYAVKGGVINVTLQSLSPCTVVCAYAIRDPKANLDVLRREISTSDTNSSTTFQPGEELSRLIHKV
jgi:F0F1-type ATP synthase epsilon subunit